MKPTLSIIIPAWNRQDSLLSTLESISQAARGHETQISLIIVDNNSTDNTRVVAESFCSDAPFSARVISCSIPGAPAARNAGFALVESPWTLFFDSDDIMHPHLISILIQAIADNPSADIVSWDIDCQNPDGSRKRRRGLPTLSISRHLAFSHLATQRFAAKTQLIKDAGAWNTQCTAWDDYELGVRLILKAKNLVYIPEVLVTTFISDNSLTEATFSLHPEKWEVALTEIEIRLASCNLSTDMINARRAILAGYYHREGAVEESERLLAQALASGKACRRLKFLYHFTVTFGRPTALPAFLLFP